MNIVGLNVNKRTDPPAITLYLKDEIGGNDTFLILSPKNETYKILYKLFESEITRGDTEVEIKIAHIPVVINGDNVKIDTDHADLYGDKKLYEDIVRIKKQLGIDDKADSPESKDDLQRKTPRKIERKDYKDLSLSVESEESSHEFFEPVQQPDLEEKFRAERLYRFSELKVLKNSDLEPRTKEDDSVDFKRFDRVTLSLDQVTSGPYTVREESEEESKKGPKRGKLLLEPRNGSDVLGFVGRFIVSDLIRDRYPYGCEEYKDWLSKAKRKKPDTPDNYEKFVKYKTNEYMKQIKNADDYLQSSLAESSGAKGYKEFISKLLAEIKEQYPKDGKKYQDWLDKRGNDSDENYKKFINQKMHKAEWLHSTADSVASNPLAFWNGSAGTHAANTHMAVIEREIRDQPGVGVEVQTFLAPETKIAEWYKYTVYVKDDKGNYDRIVFHIDAQERWYSEADYDRDQKKIIDFLDKTKQIRLNRENPPEINPPTVTGLKLSHPRHRMLYPQEGAWPFEKIGLAPQSRMPVPGVGLQEFSGFAELSIQIQNPKYADTYYKLKAICEENLKIGERVCAAVKSGNIQVLEEEFRKNPNSINFCNRNGEYPLLLALDAKNPNFTLALALIKNGANLHVTDGEGNNALHLAIIAWTELSKTAGNEDKKRELYSFIEELLTRDSKLTSKLSEDINFDKQTPLDLARQLLGEEDAVRKIMRG